MNRGDYKYMSKRSVKNYLLLIIFAFYIFAYKFYIFQHYMKYSEIISASFLVGLLSLSIYFLGFRKDKQTNLGKSVFKVVLFYLCVAFFVMYGLGLFVGFLKNAYSFAPLTLLDNIFAPIVIIICCELLRYVIVWANRDKKIYIGLFVSLLILFEICMSTKSIPFNDFEAMFRLCATIVLPIIVKNIFLTYLCYHVGYRSTLLYRLVMDVYIFLVPIVPNLGEYVQSMILISLPFFIYTGSCLMIEDKIQKPQPIFYRSHFTAADGVIAVFLAIMVGLISGLFPHYMIGIGSDSMTPKIKKGDAVILQKVNKKTKLQKDNIIAYTKDGKVVVHRIVEIKDGCYITKGDANGGNDPKPVQKKQVQGIVKLKIPFIAYPTVWLSELMNS